MRNHHQASAESASVVARLIANPISGPLSDTPR